MICIKEIKALLDSAGLEYQYFGAGDLMISGFSGYRDEKPETVVWIKSISDYIPDNNLNILIITDFMASNDIPSGYNIIAAVNSKAVFFEILSRFFPPADRPVGISETAVVKTGMIGTNVSIGHNSYICAAVSIGDNVVIKNNVTIECPTVIGNDCIIESGTVIGSAGYGYYKLPDNRIKKVPDYGGVTIGDRVEIGANTCIDKGTMSDTIINNDTKIDNLCHIAHNAVIGERCYIVASSIIQGSCRIMDDAYIAPGAIIMNKKIIGKNSFVGMGAVVTNDADENVVVTGFPAKQISTPIERARSGL